MRAPLKERRTEAHRILVCGNSGSGKSTWARDFAKDMSAVHVDLDTIAWMPGKPPVRRPLADSQAALQRRLDGVPSWVIEGCYADLLALAVPRSTQLVFLDIDPEVCVQNAMRRPYEAHKYESPDAQRAALDLLVPWIRAYPTRAGPCGRAAHCQLYDEYPGTKQRIRSNATPSRVGRRS